jgi:phosphonate transport system ATP-binding protein
MHAVELAQRHFDRLVGLREGRILFDRVASDVSVSDLDELYRIESAHVG